MIEGAMTELWGWGRYTVSRGYLARPETVQQIAQAQKGSRIARHLSTPEE